MTFWPNKSLQATRLGRSIFPFFDFMCSFHFQTPAYRRVPELWRSVKSSTRFKSMKVISKAVIGLMFAFTSVGFGQVFVNVDHGSLTQVSNDGVWRRFTTEFPIVGGWMSPGSPVDAGNGPNGAIWVHRYHDIFTAESWGVYQTPITMDQYNDPSTINRTWSWGIYWVYGENKILEYGAFDYPYPTGFWDYSISYSAAVVPEPSACWLIVLGLISGWILKLPNKQMHSNRRQAFQSRCCGFFGHWIRSLCPLPATVGDPGR